MSAPIHVEIPIQAPLAEVWRHTQEPESHQRWDLRFSRIEYLPRAPGEREQRFRYTTRIGLGFEVHGEGRSRARELAAGARASTLRFASGERRSLIREGAGFWRYEPGAGGVRFWTRYDYRVRFGRLGRAFDALAFRPLFGWATAWSFDRLRLWLERGVTPEHARRQFLAHALARIGLAGAWIWQGLVPKLLMPMTGELALASHFFGGGARTAVVALGLAEIGVGLAGLFVWDRPRLFALQLALLPLLSFVGVAADPRLLAAPFNPLSLGVSMAALAAVAWATSADLPLAGRCRRAPGKEQQ